MKEVDIVSKIVNREGGTFVPSSKGTQPIDLSDYLLKSIWDKVWEIRTDSQGTEYVFGKLPVVTQSGITMYSGDGVNVPSLASGLPFDGRTIWYNPDTKQIEVIGGTGGGSGEGVSNFWELSGIPSWITISRPKYTYSEIEGTPDLSGFATQNWIISQGYASAEELKKYIPISGYTEVSGEKNFTGGLKVNGSPIYYDTEKKYWKLEGDLLVTGGVTMYGVDSTDIPSLINSLPVATTKEKGVAYFDPNFFSVSSDGKVSFIGETGGGLDITALQNYLTQNSYLNVTEGDNRYLKLSGGTMGGDITLPKNSGKTTTYSIDFFDGTHKYLFAEGGVLKYGASSNINTIIHSGNVSSYNAGSATKLQTERTIWGRSFDGTGNVSGNLFLDAASSVLSYNSDYSASYELLRMNSAYGLVIGLGSSQAGGNLYLNGNQIFLRYGAYNTDGLYLNSSGNVGIGTMRPTRKLDIVGSMSLTGEYKIGGYDALRCYNNALEVGRETSFYQSYSTNIWGNGINFYNKEGNRLLAVTNGGNFGFGVATPTSKLHVSGDILATGGITTNDSVTINGIKLSKSKDGVLYLDGNLVVKGGVTMYGTDATSSPSILNSLPIASTKEKGVAYFDSEFFSVGSDGKVTFIGKTDGFNVTELQNYLTQNSYLNTTSGDNRYLKLSGGTVVGTANGHTQHVIKLDTANANLCDIQVKMSDVIKAGVGYSAVESLSGYRYGAFLYNAVSSSSIGVKNDGTPYYNYNTILHSGNYSSYALPLSGGRLTGSNAEILRINRTSGNPLIQFQANGSMVGFLGVNTGGEAIFVDSKTIQKKLWHEGNDGSGSGLDADLLDGKQPSDLNVGSATKLQTERTIWGRSFDGTGDVSGNLFLDAASSVLSYNSDKSASYELLRMNAYYSLVIGLGCSNAAGDLFLNGNSIYLRYGTSNIDGVIINSSGNVGIGTTKPTRKLDIVGSMSLTGEYKIGGYDVLRCYNSNLEIGRETSAYQSYGTNIWGNGISLYNQSGTRLLAVTSGGYVGIGTSSPSHKLHVVGNTYLNGDVFADELNTFDVLPRTNNAYSCGNSSLRWYQVYGNIGNFSGAVSMGSTLNVTGMTTMTNATITGDLRLKDSTNYGRAIYFGDGELCYLEEASDDVLTIYANAGIKLNTSSTSYNVSINTNLLVSGGITMYSQRSLKNIQDERGLSLGELGAIKPIRYTWKDGRDNRLHIGGIADDIQQVLPEVVYKTNDGVLTMDYGNAAFAIASSLIKPVVDHEKRIAMLEEENKQLRQEVERLKSA